jgi:hypothetical protein
MLAQAGLAAGGHEGAGPALRPAARYDQRLLARDRFEAEAVVKEHLADRPVEDLFDRVLLPALVVVRRGRKSGELRPEDEGFILRTTPEIVQGLGPPAGVGSDPPGRVAVLGVPAAEGADEVALAMLRILLRQSGTGVAVTSGLPAPGAGGLAEGALWPSREDDALRCATMPTGFGPCRQASRAW